jgi:KH/beta-lactamase-domain protein
MTMQSKIEKLIQELVPSTIEVTKVESLGPYVAIYVKDIKQVYATRDVIRGLASSLRKKVLLRTDQRFLMDMESAKAKIGSLIGPEAGITNIWFDAPFSRVLIEAVKPGLVIGKQGQSLKSIIMETGWAPEVVRTPTMPSSILDGLRKSEIAKGEDRKKFLLRIGRQINVEHPDVSWIRTGLFGAFREVGRSCFVVQTRNSRVMLDCGVNTAASAPEDAYPMINFLGFPINELDAVVLSHAHMDHCGFLPFLFEAGYEGPVYMTPPTKDLMALLQNDYIQLSKKYLGIEPPYSKKEIQTELNSTITVDYNEVIDITPDMKLTFYNAGHILGSAVTHLHIGEGKHNLIYSGDLKFGFTQLFDPAHVSFPRAETIFVESTYGGRNDFMSNRNDSEERLMEAINRAIQRKGKVLIPVFSVGRSQEILLVLEEYNRQHPEWNVPVYIDGMILEASAIHTAYPDYLRASVQKRILSNDSPFESPMIKLAYGKDKKEIMDGEPCVILAPSGMLTGGPVIEYLHMMAGDPLNTLIFVGYQSALSLGSKIQQGVREISVPGEGGKAKILNIQMDVQTVEGFSGHSDRKQLMAWLGNMSPRPRRVYTMHGDYGKTEEFAHDISRTLGVHAEAPFNMEVRRIR